MKHRLPLVLCLAALGCAGAAPVVDAGQLPERDAGARCPAGQVLEPASAVCLLALPEDCPAGTFALPGASACAPIGHLGCAAPLRAASSGWGCEATQAANCGDAGVALPDGGCGWPGDCAAPFPPSGAAYFVGFDGGAGASFTTISAALAAAPAGATIAVERGRYVEGLRPTRDGVTVVGRCAAQVEVASPGGAAPGVQLGAGLSAELRGLRLSGHRGGAVVQGGTLTLVETVLDDNRDIGGFAVSGGTLNLLRSAVTHTRLDATGKLGRGLNAEADGHLELTDSTVEDSGEVGIFVQDPSSSLLMIRAAVLGVRGSSSAAEGRGLTLRLGATGTLISSTVSGARDIGVYVSGGSSLSLSQSVIEKVAPRRSDGLFGRGISLQAGTRATLTDVTLAQLNDTALEIEGPDTQATVAGLTVHAVGSDSTGAFGMGVFLKNKSRLEGQSIALVGLGSAGLATVGSTAVLDGLLVRDVEGDANGAYGFGVLATDGSTLTVSRANVAQVRATGLFALSAGTVVKATQSLVDGVRSERGTGQFGQGVVSLDKAQVALSDSVLRAAAVTGAAFAGAGGSLVRCEVRQAPVGLFTQAGSTLRSGPVPATPAPLDVWVDEGTVFAQIATKIGAGEVPLPNPSGATPP